MGRWRHANLKKELLDIDLLLDRIHLFGDQRSFDKLFHHYYPRLFHSVLLLVKKPEIAEEIVEDVFFKLWQKKSGYKAIKNLDTYLYVAAKNSAYNYLKKASKIRYDVVWDDHLELTDQWATPEQLVLIRELKENIDKAVNNLPERCKMIFQLVREEGLSYKETALRLNISPKTVENQLAIAVKKIAEELEPYLADERVAPHVKLALWWILAGLICPF